MDIYKLLLLLALIFGINACKFFRGNSALPEQEVLCRVQPVDKYSKTPTSFSELVRLAYFSRNDENEFPELCRLLNDSIISHKTVWLWTASKIDTVNQCTYWEFLPIDPERIMSGRPRDRLFFNVCITNENEI